jgi:PAS domain S-box-containing protein
MVEEMDDYAILLLDKDGNINDWNKGAEKLKGYRADEIIGKNFKLFYTQEDRENKLPEKLISRAIAKGKANDEGWRVRKDGSRFWGNVLITAIHDKNKELAGFIKITRDLTDKKIIEEKLKQINEELELKIKERSFDFEKSLKEISEKEKRAAELIIANEELIFQNKEKEKRASELIVANLELAFQNEEKEKRAAELIIANQELISQDKEKEKRASELIVANLELVFQNEEKEKRAAELTTAYYELKIAEENIRMLKDEDIRKLNEALEQKIKDRTSELESVNKELESFSYSVSHDLRAPLRAVNGYALILEEDYHAILDAEGKRLLSIIQQSAKKMGTLIDDLLAFSRLGRKEINRSMVDMFTLLENIINEFKNVPGFNAEIKILNLFPILADITLMKQVWINLLSNAIKYSSKNEKPYIEIDAEKKNGLIIYSIADNGVGFDIQYADKLFGVFQRLHTTEEFEGTGVGLALVQRIIIKHGGKVWANAAIGKGATFYFSIPEKI